MKKMITLLIINCAIATTISPIDDTRSPSFISKMCAYLLTTNRTERPLFASILANTAGASFLANLLSDNTLKQKALGNALGLYYVIQDNQFLQTALHNFNIKYDIKIPVCTTHTCLYLQTFCYIGCMAYASLVRLGFNETILPWLKRIFSSKPRVS